VAIADPQVELAQAAARDFGIPVATASHADLIDRTDIDMVDVCTPGAVPSIVVSMTLAAGED
jgi:predicted dehydrogenase